MFTFYFARENSLQDYPLAELFVGSSSYPVEDRLIPIQSMNELERGIDHIEQQYGQQPWGILIANQPLKGDCELLDRIVDTKAPEFFIELHFPSKRQGNFDSDTYVLSESLLNQSTVLRGRFQLTFFEYKDINYIEYMFLLWTISQQGPRILESIFIKTGIPTELKQKNREFLAMKWVNIQTADIDKNAVTRMLYLYREILTWIREQYLIKNINSEKKLTYLHQEHVSTDLDLDCTPPEKFTENLVEYTCAAEKVEDFEFKFSEWYKQQRFGIVRNIKNNAHDFRQHSSSAKSVKTEEKNVTDEVKEKRSLRTRGNQSSRDLFTTLSDIVQIQSNLQSKKKYVSRLLDECAFYIKKMVKSKTAWSIFAAVAALFFSQTVSLLLFSDTANKIAYFSSGTGAVLGLTALALFLVTLTDQYLYKKKIRKYTSVIHQEINMLSSQIASKNPSATGCLIDLCERSRDFLLKDSEFVSAKASVENLNESIHHAYIHREKYNFYIKEIDSLIEKIDSSISRLSGESTAVETQRFYEGELKSICDTIDIEKPLSISILSKPVTLCSEVQPDNQWHSKKIDLQEITDINHTNKIAIIEGESLFGVRSIYVKRTNL